MDNGSNCRSDRKLARSSMSVTKLILVLMLISSPVFAQDAKLVATIAQQRNQAMDALAKCAVDANDLQSKVIALQKQVDDLKSKYEPEQKKENP